MTNNLIWIFIYATAMLSLYKSLQSMFFYVLISNEAKLITQGYDTNDMVAIQYTLGHWLQVATFVIFLITLSTIFINPLLPLTISGAFVIIDTIVVN